MAFKTLTMADILNETVDKAAFEAAKQDAPKRKKYFRLTTGAYLANVEETSLRANDKGEKHMSLKLAYYDLDTEKFRGKGFARVSWTRRVIDGKPAEFDGDFDLFRQVVTAMEAPAWAPIDEILGAIKGHSFRAWGVEMFNTPVEFLHTTDLRQRAAKRTSPKMYVYMQRDDGDEVAYHYLDNGVKSELSLRKVSKLAKDEIPF